jgi:hypothetical protein
MPGRACPFFAARWRPSLAARALGPGVSGLAAVAVGVVGGGSSFQARAPWSYRSLRSLPACRHGGSPAIFSTHLAFQSVDFSSGHGADVLASGQQSPSVSHGCSGVSHSSVSAGGPPPWAGGDLPCCYRCCAGGPARGA